MPLLNKMKPKIRIQVTWRILQKKSNVHEGLHAQHNLRSAHSKLRSVRCFLGDYVMFSCRYEKCSLFVIFLSSESSLRDRFAGGGSEQPPLGSSPSPH